MDEGKRRQLLAAAENFRTKAARDREEANGKGAAWWGYHLLMESAEYYERRAIEAETQLSVDAEAR